MTNVIKQLLVLMWLPVLLVSCIRDELQPCPPLALHVGVADCNYSNAGSFADEQIKPEQAPLSTYVKSLAWHIVDVQTGHVVVEQHVLPTSDTVGQATINLPADLPFGRYAVTVWGGLENETVSPDILPLDEPGDPYLVCDTVQYDAWHYAHTLLLKRIKSKLHIEVENLPQQYHAAALSITGTGLFAEVDNRFCYNGECVMRQCSQLAGTEVNTHTILPPSVAHNATRVSIGIYDENGYPVPQLAPADVVTTLYRNTITGLRYVYDIEKKGYDIYVRINDEWEAAHTLDIE